MENDLDKKIKKLDEYLIDNQGDDRAWYDMSRLLHDFERYDESRDAIDMAIEIDLDNEKYWSQKDKIEKKIPKTITKLNRAIWYRVIKVFFVFVILVVLLIGNLFIFSEVQSTVSIEKSYYLCDNGQKIPRKKINLQNAHIYDIDFEDAVNESLNKDGIKQPSTRFGPVLIAAFQLKEIKKRECNGGGKDVYVYTRDFLKIIIYEFYLIIIVLLISEIIKRIFYYIVFGKIRPNK